MKPNRFLQTGVEGEENVGEPHLNNDVSYLWNQIDCVIDGQLLGVTWRTPRVIMQEKTDSTPVSHHCRRHCRMSALCLRLKEKIQASCQPKRKNVGCMSGFDFWFEVM